MDFQPMLDTPLDYWSVSDRLGEIEEYHWERQGSEYYGDYADLFNELAILAAELYTDLERLINDLEYRTCTLPKRRLENTGMENARGIAWFDMAVSLLAETDMDILLENEGVYDFDTVSNERERRKRAVLALTKEMQYDLFTGVFHFLTRYIRLSLAFDAICGSIDELERLNSFRERDGAPLLPKAAYL